MTHAIGIDMGATGIKAALVDVGSGNLLSPRHRLDTPQPSTPAAVREVVLELVGRLAEDVPVGVAVPGVVHRGVMRTAANIDPSWIGSSLTELLDDISPVVTAYLNDADAAGIAEVAYGSARGHDGLVLTVTLGTGIGVAVVHAGKLVPNAELGHFEIDGADAELSCSASALERRGLDWAAWSRDVSRYLQHLERLLWPDLIVLGGGVASTPEPWFPLLKARTELRLATHGKNAGIVGAAHSAAVG